jgi:hypothetical protein
MLYKVSKIYTYFYYITLYSIQLQQTVVMIHNIYMDKSIPIHATYIMHLFFSDFITLIIYGKQ